MGIYLHKKRMDPKKHWGKEAAKGSNITKTCPNCGEQADPYEVYDDRVTYKCKNCNAINTYTQMPDGDIPKKNPKRVKKLGAVTVRDKSKNKKKKTVATRNKAEEEEPNESEIRDRIGIVKEGMKDQKVLAFEYQDAHGNKTARNIEPYKLTVDKKGDIILYGFCLEGNGIRTFKINRVKNCSKMEYSFKPQFPVEDKLKDD